MASQMTSQRKYWTWSPAAAKFVPEGTCCRAAEPKTGRPYERFSDYEGCVWVIDPTPRLAWFYGDPCLGNAEKDAMDTAFIRGTGLVCLSCHRKGGASAAMLQKYRETLVGISDKPVLSASSCFEEDYHQFWWDDEGEIFCRLDTCNYG